LLNSFQLLKVSFRRQIAVGFPEPLTHNAIEDQGNEAQAGVRLDPLGQAMKHWPNLDFGLQHAESAFDIGE
jgi:hypothetical protein